MNFRKEDYKLIAVYPDDKNRLKDKLLFEHKNGYKECFHRFDLENPRATIVKHVYAGEWSKEEERGGKTCLIVENVVILQPEGINITTN